MINTDVQMEMPKYSCHKQVWALKIANIDYNYRESVGGAFITPSDKGYSAFSVTQGYLDKHDPQVGGYYVVYKDGYKSFSPAVAFEDGYTRETGRRIGMYGETDRVAVGKYSICRQNPDGKNKSVWIEDTETGEGGEFSDEVFLSAINKFYTDNL